MIRLLYLLLFSVACIVAEAQVISSQAFSSGAEHHAAGGGYTLAGSFGQTMVYPNEGNLKGGFYPGVFVFLKPNIGPSFTFTAAELIQAGDKLQPVIKDDDGVQSTKIFYRPIARATFDSVALTSNMF